MATKKKNPGLARPAKRKSGPPPAVAIDVEAMLMIGDERVAFDLDENDNVSFMAEIIDPP